MRLADDVLAVDDRRNAIVEHRGRPLLADHADVAALARDLLRDRVQPDQAPFEFIRPVQIQYRLGALSADHLTLRRFRRRRQVKVVALEAVDAGRRSGRERGRVHHRQRREDRVMPIEAHALARQPKKIRRVALRDEVGPQPVPHHQHHDPSAPAMRRRGNLARELARRRIRAGSREFQTAVGWKAFNRSSKQARNRLCQ